MKLRTGLRHSTRCCPGELYGIDSATDLWDDAIDSVFDIINIRIIRNIARCTRRK